MNAEFLENNIEIYLKTTSSGTRLYTAKKVRNNLAPISFIGATAVTEDGTQAYRVSRAILIPSGNAMTVQAGPYWLTYIPATGEFGFSKLN